MHKESHESIDARFGSDYNKKINSGVFGTKLMNINSESGQNYQKTEEELKD